MKNYNIQAATISHPLVEPLDAGGVHHYSRVLVDYCR